LEVKGFLVDYLIQVLQDEEATKLVEVIMAENFSNTFVQELASEFNISMKNITIESIKAESSVGSKDSNSSRYDSWIQFGKVLSFFFLFLFLVGVVGIVVRRRNQSLERRLLDAEESHERRKPKGNKIRRRRTHNKMSEKEMIEEAGDMNIVEDSKLPIEDNKEPPKTFSIPEAGGVESSLPLPRGSTITPEELYGPPNNAGMSSTSDQTDLGQQSQKKPSSTIEVPPLVEENAKFPQNAPPETELVLPETKNSKSQQDEEDGINGSSVEILDEASEHSSRKTSSRKEEVEIMHRGSNLERTRTSSRIIL